MIRELDPAKKPAPTYLNHLLPPHHATFLWRVSTNDDRERKLLIFSPHFGADRISYVYRYAVEAPTLWIQGEQILIPSSASIDRTRFGWPFRSIYHDTVAVAAMVPTPDRQIQDEFFATAAAEIGLRAGFKAPDWWPKAPSVHRLPLTPIWPGLLANTAIFAAAWFTPGFIWRTARTHRRRKQGRCPACGYNMTALPTCPECGAGSTTNP